MNECAVCLTKYPKEVPDNCTTCGYDLTPYPPTLGDIPIAYMEKSQRELDSVQAMWSKYQSYVKQAQTKITQLQSQIQTQQTQIQQQSTKLTQSEQTIKQLTTHIQQLELKQGELKQIQGENQQLNQEIQQLRQQLTAKTQQCDNLTQEVKQLKENAPPPIPNNVGNIQLKTFSFEVVTVDPRGNINNRRQAQAKYFTENLGNGVTLDMVYIPGGTFLMGTDDTEIAKLCKEYDTDWFKRESPQHKVTNQPFFMSKYLITQAQWKTIATRTDLKVRRDLKPEPSKFKGNLDKLPVDSVSWEMVEEFCARLARLTKKEYCLPREAQWEYACRAGTTTPFYFGETITPDLANYDGNYTYGSGTKGNYLSETSEVGSYPPNAFGLYDLHGNLWEWCADNWHEDYKGCPNDGSAWLDKNSNTFVLRGGSRDGHPYYCRSASRLRTTRDSVYDDNGFRIALPFARTT